VIVLAVYILLAGPVVYLVLKKLRVRKYLWGCVAGFSVIFSMVIFLLGSATRFTAPFINYVKTISLDDRYMDEQIELSVRAPYNEPYQVYVNNEYDIFPVTEIDYYNSMDIPAGNFDRESVRVVYGEKENRLDIGASPAFTEKYFRAERTKELTEDPIQGELNYFDSELTGTLRNASGYDLKNCFLFFRNHLVYVGDFASGSSQNMGELEMYFFSPGYGYKLIRGLLEVPEGYVKDVTEEFLDINWKYSLLNECLIEGYHSGEERCMLIGFTEDEPMELMKDSAYRMYGQTMVVTDISLEMERVIHGSKWEYDPFVTSTAQVISGNYGTYENICYSQETVLEYKLPENLQYMQVEFLDEKYFDEETYRAFGGDIEIYHPDSKHYEKLSGRRGLDWSELKECITEEGTLLVKFRRKSDSQEKYEKLPVVITRGRRIYAED